ncbi:unnamed protein product [Fusarium equiseti]|uniref:Ankyrin repeat protein n=1 Tax=Fusarium equiseti TaxID=61235 RepID=A0A8J2IP63_FUSEQ|nr:unnamed protein product [Fusarium equiseti]
MSGPDVALTAIQICGKLATGLYTLIRETRGATNEAHKTQHALVSLHTRLEKVRFLLKTTTAQDVEEEFFRNSIEEILQNIKRELDDLKGKLRLDSILSSKTYIGKAWKKLAIRLDEGDIKEIQARIAMWESNLQTHFDLISLSSQRKTQSDLNNVQKNITMMKTVLQNARNTERLYRMEVAESCTSRTIRHEGTLSSTDLGSIVGSDTEPKYLIAIERWLESIDQGPPSNQPLEENITSCSSVIDEDFLKCLDSMSASVLEDQNHFTIGGDIQFLSPPSITRDFSIGIPRITIPSPDPAVARIRAWCEDQGFDINSPDFGYDKINGMTPDHLKGFSPIHQAINTGNNDILESMLSSHPCDLEVRLDAGNDNATPLLLACSKRNTTALRLLLEKGALRNTTDNKRKTGLHRCQSSVPGGKDFACLLLDSPGADSLDVNAPDQYGMTAVHMAVRMGDIEMLEYLLGEKQADANSRQPDGSTPLILALKHNKINPRRHDVVCTLLNNGANVTLKNNKEETAKDIAKQTKVDGDKRVLKLLKAYKTINETVGTSRSSRAS